MARAVSVLTIVSMSRPATPDQRPMPIITIIIAVHTFHLSQLTRAYPIGCVRCVCRSATTPAGRTGPHRSRDQPEGVLIWATAAFGRQSIQIPVAPRAPSAASVPARRRVRPSSRKRIPPPLSRLLGQIDSTSITMASLFNTLGRLPAAGTASSTVRRDADALSGPATELSAQGTRHRRQLGLSLTAHGVPALLPFV